MTFDYLMILDFVGAKNFIKEFNKYGENKDAGDRVIDNVTKQFRPREKDEWFVVENGNLYINHIRNVILVLCGQRPISFFRRSGYSEFSKINPMYQKFDNIARRTKVFIGNVFENKKGEKYYAKQIMTTTKCVSNCWSGIPYPIKLNGDRFIKGVALSWLRMSNYLKKEIYKSFTEMATKTLGYDVESKPVIQVFEELYLKQSPEKDAFIKSIENARMEPFYRLLTGCPENGKIDHLFDAGYGGRKWLFVSLVNRSISSVYELNGKIFIYLYKDELDLFRQGSGRATLLDGGLVRIEKIIDGNEECFDLYDYCAVPVQQESVVNHTNCEQEKL